jgi:hypothetical protein
MRPCCTTACSEDRGPDPSLGPRPPVMEARWVDSATSKPSGAKQPRTFFWAGPTVLGAVFSDKGLGLLNSLVRTNHVSYLWRAYNGTTVQRLSTDVPSQSPSPASTIVPSRPSPYCEHLHPKSASKHCIISGAIYKRRTSSWSLVASCRAPRVVRDEKCLATPRRREAIEQKTVLTKRVQWPPRWVVL